MNETEKPCCGKTENGHSAGNKIVITGAGGFVGRRLVEALADKGYKLRVLVRNDKYEAFFRLHKTEIFIGDINDPEVSDWLMDGAVGLFHLASIVQKAGAPDRDFWDTHVTATGRLLKSAIKYKVKKIIHCSTIGVLGAIANPPADETAPYNVEDIYQITKAEGEKVALEHHGLGGGMNVTVVRPSAVYGPGDRRMLKLFKYIADGKFKMIGLGETLIHPVYVDDLVDGMIASYESDKSAGRVYILGGAKYVTLNEWVSIIANAANVSVSAIHLPYTPLKYLAMICEALCKPFAIEPPLFRRRIDFFVKNRAFSINRARRELDYNPKVTLDQGAKLTMAWYKEQGWI